MDPDRWQTIEALFNATLALPRDERKSHLDAACDADAELRNELESLLKEAEHPDNFLSESTFTLASKR
jgi:hypothetical protein